MASRDSGLRAITLAAAIAALLLPAHPDAQGRGGPPARQTPQMSAPIDLTGYWVSVVTEDWRFRMVMPAKGDFQGVPMTPEAARVANAWNPLADQAAGNQCRGFGAPGIMRIPGRLHITWQDETTLRMDLDAGTQTRLFHFSAPSTSAAPSWQGQSVAAWDLPGRGRGAPPPTNGSLKVVTTRLRTGYLRRNGVPYSEGAVLTEYFDIVRERSGTEWLVVTAVVEDATYLAQPFMTSTQFKRQADASGWDPTPCSATW